MTAINLRIYQNMSVPDRCIYEQDVSFLRPSNNLADIKFSLGNRNQLNFDLLEAIGCH